MSAAPLYRNVDIKTYDFAMLYVILVLMETKFVIPFLDFLSAGLESIMLIGKNAINQKSFGVYILRLKILSTFVSFP